MLKTFDEALQEAMGGDVALPDQKIAGKYAVGKSGKTFKLSYKTIGKNTMKEATEEIFSRGYKNITKYTANKDLVYFIADSDKVIAKIFKGVSGNVAMVFHAHPGLPIKEKQ